MAWSPQDTMRLFQIESGGNPNAVTGSNRGLGQFGPEEERLYGITDANRADPNAQATAVQGEMTRLHPLLSRTLGRDPTPGELYLAHQQGVAGGPALLGADPNTPAWQVIRRYYGSGAVAQKAIGGNIPTGSPLSGKDASQITAGDFSNYWIKKFEDPKAAANMQLAGSYGGAQSSPTDLASARAAMGDDANLPKGAMPTQFSPADLAAAQAAMGGPGATFGNGLVNAGAALESVYNPMGAAALTGLARNSLAAQMAMKPTFGKIGAGPFGDIMGFIDPYKMKVTPIDGSASGTQGGMTMDVLNNISAGDEKSLDPSVRDTVKKIASYQLDPRVLSGRGGNYKNFIIQAATKYDPTYDEAAYNARAQAIKEFNSGGNNAPSSMIVAGNTALGHAKELMEYSQKVPAPSQAPLGLSILNGPANAINDKLQSDYYQNDAAKRYNSLLSKFVEEGTKFYRGTGGSEADIQRDIGNLSLSNSPEARQASLQSLAQAFQDKNNAYQDRWRTALGNSGWKTAIGQGTQDFPTMSKKAQDDFNFVQTAPARADTSTQAQPSAPAAAPSAAQVSSKADYDKLPSGASYIAPDGSMRIKK